MSLFFFLLQVQKALVDGKMVPCINAKPYVYSELLMTLQDLTAHFFPGINVNSCRQGLQDVLRLDLYRGNRYVYLQEKAILIHSLPEISTTKSLWILLKLLIIVFCILL